MEPKRQLFVLTKAHLIGQWLRLFEKYGIPAAEYEEKHTIPNVQVVVASQKKFFLHYAILSKPLQKNFPNYEDYYKQNMIFKDWEKQFKILKTWALNTHFLLDEFHAATGQGSVGLALLQKVKFATYTLTSATPIDKVFQLYFPLTIIPFYRDKMIKENGAEAILKKKTNPEGFKLVTQELK
jgi:hypothetical protein